jgi:Ca-activated chloride channel family protein
VNDLFLWSDAWPLLLLLPCVAFAVVLLERRRKQRLARVVGPRAHELAQPRRRGVVLFSFGTLLALLAMLQPLWGQDRAEDGNRRADIVICLDVSRSMLARDLAPDRLTFAQNQIRKLLNESADDRLALVVFAGEARLLVPLTRDHTSFERLLQDAGPLAVRRGGSDLGAAIRLARGALPGHGAIVLLTDGEDHEGAAARAASDSSVPVHCVGLGSDRGAKIPVEGGFFKDRSGSEVVTRMDPRTLQGIADAGGGEFARNDALVDIYRESIRPDAQVTVAGQGRRERANRFQWPLIAAFFVWVWDLGRGERRR